ncbi:hypothetical protein AVEN_133389-1 [Araneus ventricosus]|uniref:Uncharacterized protein n=1 Tax=Araneus ventricosus TaxID=182803 RepID=A0A4Y2V6Q3_ARAVE|nr:hypothetical protein AVEN_17937-1 [Araneus ventricosus]GBO19343.1 hypothetical protein AVEN_133389-1 [Araneus ventricosus]
MVIRIYIVPTEGTTGTWMRSSRRSKRDLTSLVLVGVAELATSQWRDVPPTGTDRCRAGDGHFVTDHNIRDSPFLQCASRLRARSGQFRLNIL